MAFNVIGGLGIFMLGMKYMSDGLQTIAGSRLRRMIGAVTSNRFMATGVGCTVTMLIQSSSITTVMVVGFVNAGFMNLSQAIGVIMGANIGTTITGWILVLKVGKYGLIILGVAALVYRFAKSDRWKYAAMAIMGLGMVFYGLLLMKEGFSPIRSMPEFERWFHMFDSETYFGVLKCAAVGCLLTMLVQSSSATLGITIGLAYTGVIPFHTAAALVLGENIGTTITALLASIGTTTNAKRAAYAHVIFNIIGVLWVTALFRQYIWIVEDVLHALGADPTTMVPGDNGAETYPQIAAGIAAVHTGFNVTNTLLFLPLTGVMAKFLMRFVPEKAYKEAPHLTGLDTRLLETPPIGIEQSRVEIIRMGGMVRKMMRRLKVTISGDEYDERLNKKLFHSEEVLDIMQREVTDFMTSLMTDALSHELAEEGREQLRIADEYESISDYITNLLKLHLRLEKEGQRFTGRYKEELLALHDEVSAYVRMITTAYEERNNDIVSKAHSQGAEITHRVRDLRSLCLQSVSETHANSLLIVMFTDAINAYRRVKDHALNVAECMAGEK
ncbi:MAG: Na/Pi cotransporter family protein [Phycisphaerae bacterium]|nr:Na/Pi cotransporter family protein [Phycisphaerae bacterium]